ncbi:MAG TPA: zinc-binding dehydrogenase [Anaerolineales bacterium]|nr:zinc-binding dehydrogenase [Anaerolineales bacterium]
MKSVLFRQHGGPEVLEYADFPTPEPRQGEVLVRLRAAALNRVDITVRRGWPGLKLELPHIPGCDGAGEVAAVGEGTIQFAVGDRVVIDANLGCGECEFCIAGADNMCRNWHLLGETVRGTYAEYVSLPERQLYKLPPEFGYHEAAAAALVYQTAWHSLISKGQLRPGEVVLVVGAGGGVNSASIQVARFAGARVIAVASSTQKAELARSLGAEHVIDRSQEQDWSKVVFRLTSKRGVDIVVDNVGSTFMSSLRALRKGGRLLTVGNTAGPKVEIDNRYLFSRHLSIIGSTMSPLSEFRTVMDLVVGGKLRPVIDRRYPLKDAAAAQQRLEEDQQLGKILLDIG